MGEEEEALSGLDQRERKRHPSDGAMVLVKGNWLFCSAMVRWSNCDAFTE